MVLEALGVDEVRYRNAGDGRQPVRGTMVLFRL